MPENEIDMKVGHVMCNLWMRSKVEVTSHIMLRRKIHQSC